MKMMRFLLACAAASALVGCCNDGCCKSCGRSTTADHAQTVGEVPASPSTPAVAGRMLQGQQATTPQVIGAQQMTPQNPGMIMPNAMSAKPAGESMSR
jgi:hypothetical protein